MIKWFNKIQQERREAERRREISRQEELKRKRTAQIREVKALRLITINNVRYINSYLNTLHSVVNCMKGNSIAETKRKREWARKKIQWLESKLPEEQGMILHWEKTLEKLQQ